MQHGTTRWHTMRYLVAALAVLAAIASPHGPVGAVDPAEPGGDGGFGAPAATAADPRAFGDVFGAEPLADVLAAADEEKDCGLTRDQLAAMVLAPVYPETGATTVPPSPMTVSRYDNSSGLHAFGNADAAYAQAFWHPAAGMWQFDSAGGWSMTASDMVDTSVAARRAARLIADRWCTTPTRAYAWARWVGCGADGSVCEPIYQKLMDGDVLDPPTTDASVHRRGGMVERSCALRDDPGPHPCFLVDPARAEGSTLWRIPGFGPSPVTAPFYVLSRNGREERHWLQADTGYDTGIHADKTLASNARTGLTWHGGEVLCDLTTGRGACGPEDPVATYHPITPTRILDTRDGIGGPAAPFGPKSTRTLDVTDTLGSGIPPVGVDAVVLNVTATAATDPTFVTAWPSGIERPQASNLNVAAGQTIPNLVTVAVGPDGSIQLYNSAGSVDLLADVVGWYDDGAPASGSRFEPLSPTRILDTRKAIGGPTAPLGVRETRVLDVTDTRGSGVPATGVAAVVLNLTATGATEPTFVTAWAAGVPKPRASNLNMPAGGTIPNLAIVGVGPSGEIQLFNNSGQVDVLADVVGYFTTAGDELAPVTPARILDTRSGRGSPQLKIGANQTRVLDVTATWGSGVPATGATAVVLNVTATGASADTFLTLWPTGVTKPSASNLNVRSGDTIPNLVVAKIGADGTISIYNSKGSVDVIADVVGWYG